MRAAIPALALFCAAATSAAAQGTGSSQVLNNQLQFGELFAEQTLDVVDATDQVVAVTTASGNAAMVGSEGRDLRVTSNQGVFGSVTTNGLVTVAEALGKSASITSAASGNTNDVGVKGAVLTGGFAQSAGAVQMFSTASTEGYWASAGDVSQGSQAVANSQGFGLTNASMGVAVSQYSEANVLADSAAIIKTPEGQSTVTANSVGNNITAVGVAQSAQRLVTDQTQIGDNILTHSYTNYGASYTSNTNAGGAGNNLNVTNQGPLLDLGSYQNNTSNVRVQAESVSPTFSSAAVTAYASGNSAIAGNHGPELVLDSVQLNAGGGVEAVAMFDGQVGWDAQASASAAGNASTAYACSECSGRMTVSNDQTNEAAVTATTTARMGYGRSIVGTTSAVGNNASYYVTAPAKSD